MMHRAEEEAARRIFDMCRMGAPAVAVDEKLTTGLTSEQRLAVAKASEPGRGVLVVTGGPGTGKTTTLRAIVAALEGQGEPTCSVRRPGGRPNDCKRATRREARRDPQASRVFRRAGGAPRFQRNERQPLDADVVIVDEASMIDLPLAWHLLRALPPGPS